MSLGPMLVSAANASNSRRMEPRLEVLSRAYGGINNGQGVRRPLREGSPGPLCCVVGPVSMP